MDTNITYEGPTSPSPTGAPPIVPAVVPKPVGEPPTPVPPVDTPDSPAVQMNVQSLGQARKIKSV